MPSITDEQRNQIIQLIKEGMSTGDIAARVGVATGTVAAVRAHLTMGRYDEEETETLIEASELKFGLEKDLQSALRANIEQLEPGLEIVDERRERRVAGGKLRLDITARDRSGATVIIELKAGVAALEALTQLLAYMGAVAQEDETRVRGVLIAHEFDQRIKFAARAVPNVELRRYGFRFLFAAVEEVEPGEPDGKQRWEDREEALRTAAVVKIVPNERDTDDKE